MVTELIKAVNYFTGKFELDMLATGATVDVDFLTVLGFMRKGG